MPSSARARPAKGPLRGFSPAGESSGQGGPVTALTLTKTRDPQVVIPESSKWQKTSSYYLSILFAALAFFTYEISIVLPLLLTGYIFIFKQKKYKNISNWLQLIPFYFILLIYLIIRFLGLNITGSGD